MNVTLMNIAINPGSTCVPNSHKNQIPTTLLGSVHQQIADLKRLRAVLNKGYFTCETCETCETCDSPALFFCNRRKRSDRVLTGLLRFLRSEIFCDFCDFCDCHLVALVRP